MVTRYRKTRQPWLYFSGKGWRPWLGCMPEKQYAAYRRWVDAFMTQARP